MAQLSDNLHTLIIPVGMIFLALLLLRLFRGAIAIQMKGESPFIKILWNWAEAVLVVTASVELLLNYH